MKAWFALGVMLFVFGCSPVKQPAVPIVVTIPPLERIVREFVGPAIPIAVLMPSAAMVHDWEPKPSDAQKVENAILFFAVDPAIDGWASRLNPEKKVDLFQEISASERLPLHVESGGHTSYDAHFWADPEMVSKLAPKLLKRLEEAFPAQKADLQKNAKKFDLLNKDLKIWVTKTMKEHRGEKVAQMHPSFSYLLRTAGLETVDIFEPVVGHEIGVRQADTVVQFLKTQKVRALITEPQLPEEPARSIAAQAGIPLVVLDPMGGKTYALAFTNNINKLKAALQ